MCTTPDFEILFTWEVSRNAEGRRWFYKKLKGLVSEIPEEDWKRIGGSVYLVKKEHARKFERLLSEFDGSNFEWQKFKLKNLESLSAQESQIQRVSG